jgi:hypothetical protein
MDQPTSERELTPEDREQAEEIAAARQRFDQTIVDSLIAQGQALLAQSEAITALHAELALLKTLLGSEAAGASVH